MGEHPSLQFKLEQIYQVSAPRLVGGVIREVVARLHDAAVRPRAVAPQLEIESKV